MSDPFSVTVSIAGVADLAVQVIQCLDDAKHGSKHHRALRAEIGSLHTVLLAFKEVSKLGNVQEQSNVNSTFLELPHGSLDQVWQTLERHVIKLSSATGGRGLRKVLPWHFEKAEIKRISDSIKRQRSLIELASLKHQWLVARKGHATSICSSSFSHIKAASFSDIKAVVEDMGKEIVLLNDRKLVTYRRHQPRTSDRDSRTPRGIRSATSVWIQSGKSQQRRHDGFSLRCEAWPRGDSGISSRRRSETRSNRR